MAEHRPIYKSNQNTYHLRFGFTPKTGIAFPKTFFFFKFIYFTVNLIVAQVYAASLLVVGLTVKFHLQKVNKVTF